MALHLALFERFPETTVVVFAFVSLGRAGGFHDASLQRRSSMSASSVRADGMALHELTEVERLASFGQRAVRVAQTVTIGQDERADGDEEQWNEGAHADCFGKSIDAGREAAVLFKARWIHSGMELEIIEP